MFKSAVCRLGCDCQWGGTVGELISAEEDRFNHETEECIFRQVQESFNDVYIDLTHYPCIPP